jgi:hypothetical protein
VRIKHGRHGSPSGRRGSILARRESSSAGWAEAARRLEVKAELQRHNSEEAEEGGMVQPWWSSVNGGRWRG